MTSGNGRLRKNIELEMKKWEAEQEERRAERKERDHKWEAEERRKEAAMEERNRKWEAEREDRKAETKLNDAVFQLKTNEAANQDTSVGKSKVFSDAMQSFEIRMSTYVPN